MPKRGISAVLLGSTAAVLLFAGTARADDMADLKAQIKALSDRLGQIEAERAAAAKVPSVQTTTGAPPQTSVPATLRKDESGRTPGTPSSTAVAVDTSVPATLQKDQGGNAIGILNNPVMLYDDKNTSVRLYGLIEATLGIANNQNAKGSLAVGYQTAWFSGNRLGFDAFHALSFGDDIGLPGLKVVSKLETEFESPTGNADTPGVIFNRDAWVGLESDDLGKITLGRQNTLTRDFTQNWGDAYGTPEVTMKEGGYTNVNNFKQLIFYSASSTSTRNNSGIEWKKHFGDHWLVGVGYAFGSGGVGGSGNGGPGQFNAGGGGTPGQFTLGSNQAVSVAYNDLAIGPGKANFNVSYNRANNHDLINQAVLAGGNYSIGPFRVNAGYIHYTGEQGVNNSAGTRTDNAWTVSGSYWPAPKIETDIGYVRMDGTHAGNCGGNTLLPFLQDASCVTRATVANGGKGTVFGSLIFHADKQTDFYLASDYMKVDGGWSVGDAQGNVDGIGHGRAHSDELEVATGLRFRF
ncbi:MAG TPA: porin [Acetobacteraceae bacterium]|nr:porin [Acetobacteraceae bacterium]